MQGHVRSAGSDNVRLFCLYWVCGWPGLCQLGHRAATGSRSLIGRVWRRAACRTGNSVRMLAFLREAMVGRFEQL